jgi:hypothetical protein
MTTASDHMSIHIDNYAESLLCPIGQVFMRRPVKTPCGHIFEETCILDWLARDSTCPMDRYHVTKEELQLQTDLQKEIQVYLQHHPEEDDLKEYQNLVKKYEKTLSQAEPSQEEVPLIDGHQHPRRNWRRTLRHTHRLALLLLTLSATTWVISALLDNESSSTQTDSGSIKNKALCLMLASLGITVMSSDSVINRWNRRV